MSSTSCPTPAPYLAMVGPAKKHGSGGRNILSAHINLEWGRGWVQAVAGPAAHSKAKNNIRAGGALLLPGAIGKTALQLFLGGLLCTSGTVPPCHRAQYQVLRPYRSIVQRLLIPSRVHENMCIVRLRYMLNFSAFRHVVSLVGALLLIPLLFNVSIWSENLLV